MDESEDNDSKKEMEGWNEERMGKITQNNERENYGGQ